MKIIISPRCTFRMVKTGRKYLVQQEVSPGMWLSLTGGADRFSAESRFIYELARVLYNPTIKGRDADTLCRMTLPAILEIAG